MAKFVITGATGYLGRHLVSRLLRDGHELIAISRKSPGEVNDIFPGNRLASLRFDLTSRNFESLRGVDFTGFTLVDLAWDFEPTDQSPQVRDHLTLIEKLVDLGVRKVAVSGTLQELGPNQGEIDELTPRLGTTSHGLAKTELFLRLSGLLATKKTPFLWMRLHYIIGDDWYSRSIFGRIMRDPTPFYLEPKSGEFDFIHVDQLADQIANVLSGASVGTLDFGSGDRMTFRQVLTEWLLDNGKNPSDYLHDSDGNKHIPLLGTWPRLQGLAKALLDCPQG
jgi:nucleoside-diphosphate-sugar epimerase